MAAMVLQTNLQNSRLFDKSYLIEMNEASGEFKNDFSFNADNQQNVSPIQVRTPHQGSIASLDSNNFIDQSEDQPLTKVHVCHYDECHKFRQEKTSMETAEDPSSPLKNASLILVIVLLTLWIIVYTILTQLKVF